MITPPELMDEDDQKLKKQLDKLFLERAKKVQEQIKANPGLGDLEGYAQTQIDPDPLPYGEPGGLPSDAGYNQFVHDPKPGPTYQEAVVRDDVVRITDKKRETPGPTHHELELGSRQMMTAPERWTDKTGNEAYAYGTVPRQTEEQAARAERARVGPSWNEMRANEIARHGEVRPAAEPGSSSLTPEQRKRFFERTKSQTMSSREAVEGKHAATDMERERRGVSIAERQKDRDHELQLEQAKQIGQGTEVTNLKDGTRIIARGNTMTVRPPPGQDGLVTGQQVKLPDGTTGIWNGSGFSDESGAPIVTENEIKTTVLDNGDTVITFGNTMTVSGKRGKGLADGEAVDLGDGKKGYWAKGKGFLDENGEPLYHKKSDIPDMVFMMLTPEQKKELGDIYVEKARGDDTAQGPAEKIDGPGGKPLKLIGPAG